MTHASKTFVLCLGIALLGACSKTAVYTTESFANDSPFELKTVDTAATACESARRSLLRQGYLIEKASDENVKGRKAYNSADNRNTFIEMNVVCVPDISGSTVFANGVLSTYELKKSSSAASVGLSAVGSISLPIGQSADSLVKVSEETIGDTAFYSRFFAAVDRILGDMRAAAKAAEPVPEPDPEPIPEPGPAPMPAAPEPTTVQAAPEPGPVQAAPATMPASAPVQAVPATTPEAVAPEPVPMTVPEPMPAEAVPTTVPEPGVLPAAEPATSPMVTEPVPAPEEATFGPAFAPATAPTAPVAPESLPPPLEPDDGLEPIPLPEATPLLR
ncbi:MAG: DUF2242 domain-containing protein [Pseudomonadales bacterium]|nr:DUF2242 domain-containing protein [Gammaproteobacteria bacterium]MBP6481714.1 DUF2242 domain-containing protein [Pseudomonadales bacterium]MBP7910286.1 DUF2242 domain-containing protein [Pseudomonadales bacterium]